MVASLLAKPIRAAVSAFALAALAVVLVLAGQGRLQAQSQPSANAVALAKEIIVAKASTSGFDTVGPAVIERAKSLFLQTNPNLFRDLNEVAAKLRADYAARFGEPVNDAAKVYASKFTEQELKDILAFYKTPAGKKVVIQEPLIIQESMSNLDQWASILSEEVIAKFRAEMKKKGHDL